ncbi:hypothetical protein SELSPUOL_00845 [Selenomonas sputigena ATCC 35185]|uniref:Uncharacterized protein n=1 Tax=Selenomonas sputigena (strain ATCC 35185 / DSM 20758 / CCUG 44933 / VPI D19B-28) TaxID=546271 RepID=C9LU40_SELS3|nr:hypothetical protein SELSPUOL_00845 [Selenomonas sputigena ATCC 35185]
MSFPCKKYSFSCEAFLLTKTPNFFNFYFVHVRFFLSRLICAFFQYSTFLFNIEERLLKMRPKC